MASLSKAQLSANRQNAKKSTGPKTEEGKLIASQNSRTHGVLSNKPLLPGEDEAGLQELKDSLFDFYKPTDAIEYTMVERIVMGHIRQSRLQVAEAAKLNISMDPEIIVREINKMLGLEGVQKLTTNSISEKQETNYQFYIEVQDELNHLTTYEVPLQRLAELEIYAKETWKLMPKKAKEYNLEWDVFIKNPSLIARALKEIHISANEFIERYKISHTGYLISNELKLAKRIPAGKDFDDLNRYQTQIDMDIIRANDQLRKHRELKMKTIDAEVLEATA